MRTLLRTRLPLLLLASAAALPAQTRTVTVSPDTLTLAVGDTARPLVAVRAGGGQQVPGAALTYSGAHSSVITAHRDGLITARGIGCTTWRATHATYARAQVAVCVVAAAPAPAPEPTPTPTPTPTPAPGTFVFASDWSAATGSTNAALTDGGRWNTVYCQSAAQTLAVVPGAALGWTKTANVLRLQQRGESTCGMLEKANAVPASTSHYGRFYFRNDETSTQHHHVATLNPIGDIQVTLWAKAGRASGVQVHMRLYKDPAGNFAGWPHSWYNAPTLQNGRWYRYEWHMEYVTATTYRLWPRIYDLAGTLIADAHTYRDSDGGRTLAEHYATGATFGINPTLARNFGLGNEGPATSTNSGGYWYHADVALSLTDWIGR